MCKVSILIRKSVHVHLGLWGYPYSHPEKCAYPLGLVGISLSSSERVCTSTCGIILHQNAKTQKSLNTNKTESPVPNLEQSWACLGACHMLCFSSLQKKKVSEQACHDHAWRSRPRTYNHVHSCVSNRSQWSGCKAAKVAASLIRRALPQTQQLWQQLLQLKQPRWRARTAGLRQC